VLLRLKKKKRRKYRITVEDSAGLEFFGGLGEKYCDESACGGYFARVFCCVGEGVGSVEEKGDVGDLVKLARRI
jgi:hypothetical protein